MNVHNVWTILLKDIRRAPRSGIVMLALGYPLLLTLMLQVVFGAIFDPPPRIGLVTDHPSAIADGIAQHPSAEVQRFDTGDAMWDAVRAGDIDLGLHFKSDVDADVAAHKKPDIEAHASTLANGQSILKADAIVIKQFINAGDDPPFVMKRVHIHDRVNKSWVDRLVPMLILLTFLVAGTFLTGFALVDEKLRGTMKAILTTPTSMAELISAKAIFSYGIAVFCSLMAMALNDALHTVNLELFVGLTISAVMTIQLGVVLGLLSKDISALYGAIKAVGPVFAISALPYVWDGFPLWVAKLFPTWYVLHPIVEIINHDATFADVWVEFAIACGICGLLLFAMKLVSGRTLRRLDAVH